MMKEVSDKALAETNVETLEDATGKTQQGVADEMVEELTVKMLEETTDETMEPMIEIEDVADGATDKMADETKERMRDIADE